MQIAALIAQRPPEAVVTVTPDTGVAEALRLLAERRIGAVPVLENEQLLGIFSERDAIYGLAAHGSGWLAGTVGAAMTSPAVTATPATTVLEALALMTRRRVRHLPVLEHGRMCGFVSIGDLVKSRLDEIEGEAEAMRQYISTA